MKSVQHSRIVFCGRTAAIVAALPLLIWAYATGPDPGLTGAPGEANCTSCHSGAAAARSGIEFDVPGGMTYVPGVKKALTVRITGTGTVGSPVYGFQASPRLVSNTRMPAGHLTATDPATFVLCQGGSQNPTGECPGGAAQFVEHNRPKNTNTFTFDWTPPATNVGEIRFYIAANVGNGNNSDSGDRIFLADFTLTPEAQSAAPQIRAQQPVLQAFAGGERISSGTWVEIYGTNFATATKDWTGLFQGSKAPTAIDGISVNVDNKPAFMYFVSPTQINAQVPDGVGSGPVKVEVVTPGGRSETTAQAAAVSPALLTTPLFNVGAKQYAAALFASDLNAGRQVFVGNAGFIGGVTSRPAKPGDVLTIFAVGCGATAPPSPAGEVVSGLKRVSGAISLRFGPTTAQAEGFMTPDAIGLCQINATVPNVGNGDHALSFGVGGVDSTQSLQITVQQ